MRGTTLAQTVRRMLEEARKEADIIKITCLDNKLTQIDVNNRTAEARLDALKKAVDNDRRTHEFTVLTVIGQKLQVLDQEAHQCVGQSMYDTGATKVVTEIDTNMLPYEDNPSMPPVDRTADAADDSARRECDEIAISFWITADLRVLESHGGAVPGPHNGDYPGRCVLAFLGVQ